MDKWETDDLNHEFKKKNLWNVKSFKLLFGWTHDTIICENYKVFFNLLNITGNPENVTCE